MRKKREPTHIPTRMTDTFCTECRAPIYQGSADKYDGKCVKCYRAEKIEIPCPRCGRLREVGRQNAARAGFEDSVCRYCANEMRPAASFKRKGKRMAAKVAPIKNGIRINGCFIVPASSVIRLPGLINSREYMAARCRHYTDCKHGMYADIAASGEEACVDIVARTWPRCEGWVAAGVPDLLTPADVARIKTAILAAIPVGEQAEWSGVSRGRE